MAVLAASLFSLSAAYSDDTPTSGPVKSDGVQFETSARYRASWTEIAYRGPRPKAWDMTLSPELRASLRVLGGLFEGKIELGLTADRFDELQPIDSNSIRIDVQAGINTGAWSYLLEWKARDVYTPDFDDFVVRLDTYDLRVRRRFSATVFDGLPPSLWQASVTGGHVAAMPHIFERDFAELELEVMQRLPDGFAITVAPKLELFDYDEFPGDRRDAALSVRLIPAYNFSGGVTLSVEGQATVAFSTLETKAGETWSLTPILRLQKAW